MYRVRTAKNTPHFRHEPASAFVEVEVYLHVSAIHASVPGGKFGTGFDFSVKRPDHR